MLPLLGVYRLDLFPRYRRVRYLCTLGSAPRRRPAIAKAHLRQTTMNGARPVGRQVLDPSRGEKNISGTDKCSD